MLFVFPEIVVVATVLQFQLEISDAHVPALVLERLVLNGRDESVFGAVDHTDGHLIFVNVVKW